MGHFEELWSESGTNTERLVFFSDAVFAIALTLLVIDVRIPEELDAPNLAAALQGLSETLLALVISFFTISAFWRSHHRMFHVVTRYNPLLITLNFVMLLGVVLVPFTTSLVSRYGTQELAMLIFIADVTLTSLMLTVMWMYVVQKRLIDPALPPQLIHGYTVRSVLITLTFLAAAPCTLIVGPSYAPLVWLILAPLVGFAVRSYNPRPNPAPKRTA